MSQNADRNNRVRILSLQTGTFKPSPLRPRQEDQSIIDFAKGEIEHRQLHLTRALESSLAQLKHDPFHPHVTFFTAPEFYWNIPWTVLRNKDELHQLSTFYKNSITEQVQRLIRKFPEAEWGRLVLLPGTTAVLVGTEKNENRYEAINYVLAANNFSPDTAQGTPPLSMWPKRFVSGLDFLGLSSEPEVLEDQETIIYSFTLSETLSVEVEERGTVRSEHYNNSGYSAIFDNQLLSSLPFGIAICADVGLNRLEELKRSDVKLDFLIACGMYLPKGAGQPESVQYLIRNDGRDGMSADGTQKIPQCETWRVVEGKTSELVPGRLLDHNVWLYQLNVT